MDEEGLTGAGPTEVVKAPEGLGDSITASEAARAFEQSRAASEAGRALAQAKHNKPREAAAPVEAAEPEVTAPEADAAPLEEAPGETEEADPADLPPIEPPRSWTKEAKERWQSLPHDTQEYIASRERDRELELRRGQDEAALKAKDYQSKAERAEQERQKYEAALPLLMQQMASQFTAEFPDIRSPQDLERLAREEPARYVLADLKLKSLQNTQSQLQEAHIRQSEVMREGFGTFAKEQDKLFDEKVPSSEAKELKANALDYLRGLGFSEEEVAREYGSNKFFRDHRTQLLIRDAMRYRAKEAAGEVARKTLASKAKPLPKVQRPGAAPVQGASKQQQIASLYARMETSKGNESIRLATQLYELQREPH